MMNKLEFEDYVAGLDTLSGFDLYKIYGLIQQSLSNPNKQLEYITKLRIGLSVDYINAKTQEQRKGEIVQILQQFVVVKDSLSEHLYKMPPYMLRTQENGADEFATPRKAIAKKAVAKKVVSKAKPKAKPVVEQAAVAPVAPPVVTAPISAPTTPSPVTQSYTGIVPPVQSTPEVK